MSGPYDYSASKDDRSRADPGEGWFLRGSTWAIEDYAPSKQERKIREQKIVEEK
jgi:hypothetical protein